VIENTEFSEKSRLFDFICQIKQAAFFILFVKADIRNPIQIPLMPH